jgi:hypothetical protein
MDNQSIIAALDTFAHRPEIKQSVINALYTFVHKRPQLEFGNYGDVSAYRSESRAITKDLHHARHLLRALEIYNQLTAEDIIRASEHAFSGRLTINVTNDGLVSIDYCTGQYFPTEYRKAVAAICASTLWTFYRNKCGYATGERIRQAAKRDFSSTSIVRNYFN